MLAAASLTASPASLPRLTSDAYQAYIDVEIWQPGADEPVKYRLNVLQQAADDGAYAPCSYLIVSTAETSSDDSQPGFAAYFGDTFITFANDRMRVYDAAADSLQFISGLPRNEKFTSLLPAFINEQFAAIATDSTYHYQVDTAGSATKINGEASVNGYTLRRFEYAFDRYGRPVLSETTMNPGSYNEQIVSASYSYPAEPDTIAIDRKRLEALFPDEFAKFAPENFRPSSLVGHPLPSFSLQQTGDRGVRLAHRRGEGFDRPTLIVFLDSADPAAIAKARGDGADGDIIYVYSATNPERVEEEFGKAQPNETVAYHGASLARDCGVRAYPSFIFCDQEGVVSSVEEAGN